MANLKDWSIQVTMAYYIVVIGAFFIGSIGRGKEIASTARAYRDGGPEDPDAKIGRGFTMQIVVSLGALFVMAFAFFRDF